jgi:hypothetical protein
LECAAETDRAEKEHLKISWLKNGKTIDFTKTKSSISLNTETNSLIITGINDVPTLCVCKP